MASNTYEQTLSEYTTQLRGLFAAAPGPGEAQRARLGGAGLDGQSLAERSGQLADTSLRLGELTSAYLESDVRAVREAAELKLLAQANAELEVAVVLLQAVEEEVRGKPARVTRSGRATGAARAVDELANVLDAPLEAGLQPFVQKRATRGARTSDPRKRLQEQVRRSLRTISRQAGESSSQALDTLIGLDPDLIKKAVAPVGQEIAELLEKIAKGVNEIIRRLLNTAFRFLLQAYDWVLALIGKDAEQAARKRVQEWIEELRTSHKKEDDTPDLAEKLVNMVYLPDTINAEVAEWLKSTQAETQAVQQATDLVEGLAANFEVKVQRVKSFLRAVSAIRGAATGAAALLGVTATSILPALEVVRAAVLMGLMGYTLFTGYDHVDSGKATFFDRFSVTIPDRVEGVRETVQKALGAN